MSIPVTIDEVFIELIPTQKDLDDIHECFQETSFDGIPSRLAKQHIWLDALANLTDSSMKLLRQQKGVAFQDHYLNREVYRKLFYVRKLYKVLERSVGDLTTNEYAKLYEFNVLLVVKWVIFSNSRKKFNKFLIRLNAQKFRQGT